MESKTQQKSAATTEVVKKPKSSRNTEKRRERSKVAARCRRGKESEIFTELSDCLPVSESSKSNLDKASVMRLTLCDLRMKEMLENIDGVKSKPILESGNGDSQLFDSLINSAVSGFVLVCSCDGDVIYVSEGIASCLGLSQYEVMGQSLLEFCHPCDQGDVKEMLVSSSKSLDTESKSALFRMKSSNSTRGRNVHHRTTNYKVVSCFGRIFYGNGGDVSKKWFVGICEPLLHPSDVDIPLNKQTFLSKHSPDMKFEYVDESISEFLGYKTNDILGKSLFDFYHACDGEGIGKSFKSLYGKGQTVTERSRFLAKGGGWIWVVTQATSISNNAGKPTSVVCIHFVTSGVECTNEILSHVQLRGSNEPVIVPTCKPTSVIVQPTKKPLQETTNLSKPSTATSYAASSSEVTGEPLIVNPFTGPILSKPTPSTAKIFAPRTEDMDTGFLMPVNDTLIVTKEEPEDLTHLAPIAGDECVPLSNVPLLDDLLQWLDAADMEYAILEGYEEPLPLPLIAAVSDTSIPLTMTMCPPDEMVVKNDVVLERMPSPHCDSPLLLRNSDATSLSPDDPMLLSPFKTPSPEPSASCMDIFNPDMFSSLYEQRHMHSGGVGGGGTASSSDKCKDGGRYDDAFSGFPVVSDFQEHIFSPCSLDDPGPPVSPVHSLVIDRGGGGSGGQGIPLKLDTGGSPYIGQPLGTMTKDPESNVVRLKYMMSSNTPNASSETSSGPPPPVDVERPLPNKVAKPNYGGTVNKAWLHPASVTPPQPPWKIMGVPQSSPSMVGSTERQHQQPTRKRIVSTTTGTQTMHFRGNTNSDQRNRLLYQQLLRNPLVLQTLMSRRFAASPEQNGGSYYGRKRNFLGKLLGHGLLNIKQGLSGVGGLEMATLVELTNQDCEVNAPLESQPLLDGPELLTALDTAGNATDLV